jgi:hypothetical protein
VQEVGLTGPAGFLNGLSKMTAPGAAFLFFPNLFAI